jgi:hypothetical protein
MRTITLPPDLEDRLAEEAQRRGTTAELLAVDTLRKAFVPTEAANGEQPAAKNLTEYLGSYVGAIHGPGEPISRDKGRLFTDYLVEKKKQGRL